MKRSLIVLVFAGLITPVPGIAKEISVPREIDGHRVHYVMWSKKHASGSESARLVGARFRSKMKVPYPFANSKTCFLNRKREIIACR